MCTETTSTSSSSSRRRKIAVVISALLFVAVLHSIGLTEVEASHINKLMKNDVVSSQPHRKLLSAPKKSAVDKPARFWGDAYNCTDSDIQVTQGAGPPLPSGIPTYTVHIVNACDSGCSISDIHIHCGSFSTARLINPRIFKRLHYNDCLVNGGRTLQHGHSISFQYADTSSYPFNLAALSCLRNLP